MRIPGLFVALSFCLNSCVGAQAATEPLYRVVLPGDVTIDTDRITPHAVRYERPGGFMNYDLHLTDLDGVPVYELEVYFNQEGGEPDRMYFDPVTLGYVGRRLTVQAYTVDVRLLANRMTGTLTPGPGSDYTPVTYNRAYAHGGFEPAILNYWIAALPLEEGYTASLPIFDLSNGSGMFWANIEVVGRETLEVQGREYDTWKVVSHGIKEKTIWVTGEVPYAIKMITRGSFRPWVVAAR